MELVHTSPVVALALSWDGKTAATATEDGRVFLWDSVNGKCFARTQVGSGVVAFSRDCFAALLTTAYSRVAFVKDLRGLEKTIKLEGHTEQIGVAAFLVDGLTLLTGSCDHTARVWDLRTGETIHVLRGHTKAVTRVAVSYNGETGITGSIDDTTRVWDLRSGECLRVLDQGRQYNVCARTISPDGRLGMASSLDGGVRVLNLRSGDVALALPVQDNYVTLMEIAPDGRTAVTITIDGTVRVWDLRTKDLLRAAPLKAYNYYHKVAFSRDRNTLLVSVHLNNGTARFVDITPQWKLKLWTFLSTPKWDGEMARELSHFF